MNNDNISGADIRAEIHKTIDEIVQRGAQRLLAMALEAEVASYLARHTAKDEEGKATVVRNGYAKERTIASGAGELTVKAPRVHDRRDGHRFTSHILPAYMRRTPRLEEAIPVLYLRGLSTSDFKEALATLFGQEAVTGFSASTVTRLLSAWQEEYKGWRKRNLATSADTYMWVDVVHFNG